MLHTNLSHVNWNQLDFRRCIEMVKNSIVSLTYIIQMWSPFVTCSTLQMTAWSTFLQRDA